MADETKKSLPKQAGKEIGKSGTLIFQGLITQEDYNANFTGAQLIRQVEIMRRSSSTVRGTLLVVKLPILSANWGIDPAQLPDGGIDERDQEIRDFVYRELFKRNVNFYDFLRQGSTHLDFGYSVFEKIYELTDFLGQTRIGINKLGFRKQKTIFRWEMSDGGDGIHQLVADGSSYDIPREKLIIFTNEKEGDNHEGVSLLRYAYKDWDILDKLQIVNAVALEKMGVGVPIVSARENQTPSPDDVEKAEEVAQNIRANEASFLSMPASMEIEMLDMKANTTKEIIPSLNYHDRRISASIIAGFTELGGQSGSGSQSLSKDLTSLFMKAEEATARTIQSTIQEDLIKQLVDLNYADLPNGYPQITFGKISDDDLVELATSVGTLAEKQLITPDVDLEAHLRRTYHLPAMTDDVRAKYEDNEKPEDGEDGDEVKKTKTTDKSQEDETLKKTDKKPANPADVKASLEEARAKARSAKKDLIDAITG